MLGGTAVVYGPYGLLSFLAQVSAVGSRVLCITMEAQKKAQGAMEKAMRWLDSFHNVEPQRAPSSIGCALTVLMFPVVLVYVIVWVVNYQNQPPVETLVIDWSVAKGPFPMKVQCAEANCWMWLSGCNSDASGQCIALTSGQEHTLQMCSWVA